MSYNGSGLFQINTSGQPVVAGTVITASAFNALTADLATGLTTAITKDGQTATTAQIPFAQGLRSTLVTDSTTSTSGSIITDGGLGVAKAVNIGTTLTVTGAGSIQGLTVGKGAGAVATNTAVGASALAANTSGATNTAIGYQALTTISTGSDATAVGWQALQNATGATNTAFGSIALWKTTTGVENTAVGKASLAFNTTGSYNIAVGKDALISNTTASNNTAVGYQAGYSNSTGVNNAFFGWSAGYSNTTGEENTFIGNYAGYAVTTGTRNTIIGRYSGNQGGLDIRTASNYIVLSDGDGNPRAYWNGAAMTNSGDFSNTGDGTFSSLFCGSVSVNSRISRASSGTGTVTYYIGNQTITTSSDARLKDNIKPTERNALELLNQWEIVDHTWNDPSDQCKNNRNSRGVWTGVIAQQVQPITPWLVNKPTEELDENGDMIPWTMDFGYAVPLLVKAIQELKAEFDAYKAAHP